jgi:hypothetical protein
MFVYLECGAVFTDVCVLRVWYSFLKMFVFLQCGTAFFTDVCVLTVWYIFLQMFVFLQCGTAFYRCMCS